MHGRRLPTTNVMLIISRRTPQNASSAAGSPKPMLSLVNRTSGENSHTAQTACRLDRQNRLSQSPVHTG